MPATQNDPTHAEPSSSVYGNGSRKAPYGAGDADEGYTLTFESMAAFEAWRAKEEEEKMIEFVRNDRHVSKSVPPRFREHTKLVCARHSKSGRSKYVKKYPDRHRKVPSRKLEGTGCSASISFKTYYETEDVRVCYRAQHSHEIGLANLPFTRRGRRAQVEQEKARSARRRSDVEQSRASTSAPTAVTPGTVQQLEEPGLHSITPEIQDPPSEQTIDPALFAHNPTTQFTPMTTQPVHQLPSNPAPPPPQPQQVMPPPPPQPAMLTQIAQIHHPQSLVQDEQARWDRMSVLFEHVRNAARTFEHAPPSVAALETVLVRMYLESPLTGSGPIARSSN
ncbi:hypothetical protein BDM02DRAFT_3104406 [Thelephora ganbajun]|uniref:Uncharacterized protein n=1 Tax=Thelephora ganbajun TaxID=370292 RepID=A0ACB6Z1K8_THEGA|nr:hypothetical protein BDM02DRAFT_3104406 [Thelephora ganbajun]